MKTDPPVTPAAEIARKVARLVARLSGPAGAPPPEGLARRVIEAADRFGRTGAPAREIRVVASLGDILSEVASEPAPGPVEGRQPAPGRATPPAARRPVRVETRTAPGDPASASVTEFLASVGWDGLALRLPTVTPTEALNTRTDSPSGNEPEPPAPSPAPEYPGRSSAGTPAPPAVPASAASEPTPPPDLAKLTAAEFFKAVDWTGSTNNSSRFSESTGPAREMTASAQEPRPAPSPPETEAVDRLLRMTSVHQFMQGIRWDGKGPSHADIDPAPDDMVDIGTEQPLLNGVSA